jgi:opacity protein-like surface antigen
MFRKSFAVLAFLFISGNAVAQQGFYVNVGYGQAEVTSKNIFIAIPQGNTLGRYQEDDSSFKVQAGYRLNKFLGIEGTWQDFGDPDAYNTGILDEMGNAIVATIDTTALQLAALGFLPLGDGVFDIFGRIGVSVVDEELGFSGVPPVAVPLQVVNTGRDESNTLFVYGFGAQLNLLSNRNLILRVEWEQTQGDVVERYDYIGATLGFKFGGR